MELSDAQGLLQATNSLAAPAALRIQIQKHGLNNALGLLQSTSSLVAPAAFGKLIQRTKMRGTLLHTLQARIQNKLSSQVLVWCGGGL